MSALSIINNEFNLFTLLYIYYDLDIVSSDTIINIDYASELGQSRLNKLLYQNKTFKLRNPKKEYEYVFAPSNMTKYIFEILDSIHYQKLILIEDGTYDYTKNVVTNAYTKHAIKYVFNKSLIKIPACQELRQVKLDKSVNLSSVFQYELDYIHNLNINAAAILFTAPMEADFGMKIKNKVEDYFDKIYPGDTILIKKHPRDFGYYHFQKCKGIELPTSIFGQLLVNEIECLQYYEFPSTTIISAMNPQQLRLFQFDTKNDLYIKGYQESNLLKLKAIRL